MIGMPIRTNRYHWMPTRQRTYLRRRCTTPALPSVTAVMTNAPTVGPNVAATMAIATAPFGIVNGRMPCTESAIGTSMSHENRKAITKYDVSGCRASSPFGAVRAD